MATDDEGSIDIENLSVEKIARIGRQLDAASRCGIGTLRHRLTSDKIDGLFKRATRILKTEPTVVDLVLDDFESKVTVVGDTHGQFHDVLHMFDVVGVPGKHSVFLMNGDFVDRGSWGLETLIYFVCWKLLYPTKVYLIRGNHESQLMTELYGYKAEVEAKYSRAQNRTIYAASKKLFASMPLAVVVQEKTFVCHGGLFRSVNKGGRRRRKTPKPSLGLGTLNMLRSCSKGGIEPTGLRVSSLVSDVLWSDPVTENGLMENESRGLGLMFGPDITDAFLRDNQLKLVIRAHEGPDARFQRVDMADMMKGYAVDHDVEHGKLVTVFSAPDYPQFQDTAERTNNAAAVVVLTAPDYSTPCPVHFNAVLPRPDAPVFYDLDLHAETDVNFDEVHSKSDVVDDELEEGDDNDIDDTELKSSVINAEGY